MSERAVVYKSGNQTNDVSRQNAVIKTSAELHNIEATEIQNAQSYGNLNCLITIDTLQKKDIADVKPSKWTALRKSIRLHTFIYTYCFCNLALCFSYMIRGFVYLEMYFTHVIFGLSILSLLYAWKASTKPSSKFAKIERTVCVIVCGILSFFLTCINFEVAMMVHHSFDSSVLHLG